MSDNKKTIWNNPFLRTRVKSDNVKAPEMLLGYYIGPFGALLASGIFTSILQNYFTDVLKMNLTFLTTLQLISTILIVIANLVVGQLIFFQKRFDGIIELITSRCHRSNFDIFGANYLMKLANIFSWRH